MHNQADYDYFTFESEATCCDGFTMGCIWRPFFETCHPSEMFDEGTPIFCSKSSIPTVSLIQSGYMLDDTDAPPTSAPPRSPVVNATDPW